MNAMLKIVMVWMVASRLVLSVAQSPHPSQLPVIFEDVSQQAGIGAQHHGIWDPDGTGEGYLAIGQAWGDYDNDGWLDLYVTGNLAPNVLYHNDGDGTFSISEFSERLSLPDVPSGGVVWADYDNDGWLDLYVLNYGANVLFRNDTGEGFTDVTAQAGVGDTGKGTSAGWGDYDNDGWLDLYVVNWSCFPECDPVDFSLQQDRLYHNNGDGTFTDVTDSLDYEKTLGAGFIPSFMDYDNDGDLDLYIVNDYLQNEIGNVMWRNDGEGCGHWCWTDVSVESGLWYVINGMGLDVSDYDNDGDLDLYMTDMVYTMYLMQNRGDGTFRNEAAYAGVAINYQPDDNVAWGAVFFDYDNDGWQDLYVATTNFYQSFYELIDDFMKKRDNAFFHNLGDGTFDDVSVFSGIQETLPTMGVAYADYDNDGDLDLVTGNWNAGYRLYQNINQDLAHHQWISIELIGNKPINRNAVGSRVYITRTDDLTQLQEVKIGSGLGGNSQLALHFGLGTADIAKIKVVWSDGSICHFEQVDPQQNLKIHYDTADICVVKYP